MGDLLKKQPNKWITVCQTDREEVIMHEITPRCHNVGQNKCPKFC